MFFLNESNSQHFPSSTEIWYFVISACHVVKLPNATDQNDSTLASGLTFIVMYNTLKINGN